MRLHRDLPQKRFIEMTRPRPLQFHLRWNQYAKEVSRIYPEIIKIKIRLLKGILIFLVRVEIQEVRKKWNAERKIWNNGTMKN